MSQESGPVSSVNLGTIATVAFVLSLLSIAINFYNSQRTNEAIVGFARLQVEAAARDGELKKRVTELEALTGRVEALEARAAAPAAEAPPAPQ